MGSTISCGLAEEKGLNVRDASLAIDSFYHLHDAGLQGRACRGLACFAARNDDPPRWRAACEQEPSLYCLGQCHDAPSRCGDEVPLHVEVHARRAVLLGNVVQGGAVTLQAYEAGGGGKALSAALTMSPDTLLDMIAASGLRGRGGAGFPTGRKWAAVAQQRAAQKYVVANADEGDPGAFSDRVLLERDPFRLIEAMAIAAVAVGANKGFIYLRREYPRAAQVLRDALQQARAAGWIGERMPDSPHRVDLQLVIGKGGYVCGEETAMLNAIEGRRPEVRVRPPQIVQHGLFGAPTLVNNVETLCAVPWIVAQGSAAYASLGCDGNRGTKLLSLNSLFRRPGLYEVEFGITLREIVDRLGGGLRRGELRGVMIGGPLAGLIPPTLLDTRFDHESLQHIGAAVGHGGVIAFADDSCIAEIVAEVFRFGAFESCGKCTPCRLGSPEIARMFANVIAGNRIDRTRWHELVDALAAASLCGHGRGLAEFAHAIERHYPEELAACFA